MNYEGLEAVEQIPASQLIGDRAAGTSKQLLGHSQYPDDEEAEEGVFRNPRPPKQAPYQHNNAAQASYANAITGSEIINRARYQWKFGEKNMKSDVLTGDVKPEGAKASAYEGFNGGNQGRPSNNFSQWPQDMHIICPITGRKIIKK